MRSSIRMAINQHDTAQRGDHHARAGGEAVSRTRVRSASRVYIAFDKQAMPIVGVVDRLQVPWSGVGGWGSRFFDNSILEPFRMVGAVLRSTSCATKPGQLDAVMKTVRRRLLIGFNRDRVLVKVAAADRGAGRGLQGRSRLGGDPGDGVRGAAPGHGLRHRRPDQLLGGAAAPPDRHSPRARREPAGHRALFPDGEPADRRGRRGRSASRSPSPRISGWSAASRWSGSIRYMPSSARSWCCCWASSRCYGRRLRAASIPPALATRGV